MVVGTAAHAQSNTPTDGQARRAQASEHPCGATRERRVATAVAYLAATSSVCRPSIIDSPRYHGILALWALWATEMLGHFLAAGATWRRRSGNSGR